MEVLIEFMEWLGTGNQLISQVIVGSILWFIMNWNLPLKPKWVVWLMSVALPIIPAVFIVVLFMKYLLNMAR